MAPIGGLGFGWAVPIKTVSNRDPVLDILKFQIFILLNMLLVCFPVICGFHIKFNF